MDPFVAEIRMFGFNFAPKGWATCDGQILPLSQNTALFSLLGTMYGGDGRSNFALPNLDGSAPMFFGQGPGLTEHFEGESGGSDTVTLIQSEMPSHTHTMQAANFPGDIQAPTDQTTLARSTGGNGYQSNAAQNLVPLNPSALPPAGGGQPHNNLMPYLTLTFCIALQGVFPPRG
jgi:microcystin-dependent protein